MEVQEIHFILKSVRRQNIYVVDCFYRNDIYQISSVKIERGAQLDLIFSSMTDNITVSKANSTEQILKNSLHHSAIAMSFKL
jgi:uncharacterized protein YcbK (DUF882 family)